MSRFHLFPSLGVFVFGLVLISTASSQSGVLDHNHRIELGGKKIDVTQENIEELQRKISKPMRAHGAGALTRARVEKLAREFGLLEKTETNPHLAFLENDISYWHKQNLDENRLQLEFAARKLVLESADKQRVAISDKETLSLAARQIIPILQKERNVDVPDINRIACEGDTSQRLTEQSWEGLKIKNFEKTLACTSNAIKKWSRQADTQQTKAANGGCSEPPQPTDLKSYFASNWALSDIATSWFIRGEVFYQQGKWAEAKEAYKTVVDKYHCAFAWDPRGWFWRTADSAQEKYDEIRLR